MTLLIAIKDQVAVAKAAGQNALPPDQLTDFEQQYRSLIEQGLKANPPPPIAQFFLKHKGRPKQSPPKNLLDRLGTNQAAVLAFMYNFRVPFDNSQAERDLRLMKLKMFCRIRGYISTLRKQGINVLDALKHFFMEDPVLPALQPE